VSADIDSEFSAYLSGEQPSSPEVFEQMWQSFTNEHGANSPNNLKPVADRKKAFAKTIERIIEHNSKPSSTYKKGINKFSDMTHEEFADYFHLDDISEEQHCSATEGRQSIKKNVDEGMMPRAWDWRRHGGVSPVKNQGSCGSCWTFSAVGCLESAMMLKYGGFTSLSEQQLVDCAGDYDNHGCMGGLPSHAFEYIHHTGGISTETAYPYFAEDRPCTVDPATFALTVKGGSFNITEGDETELKHAVFEKGPVAIAFQVVSGFSDYKSGVYTSDVCKNSTDDVNHAVLAVGYGHQQGMDYWLVKNSWGADWGDEGYFKIQRGVNMCGVAVCNSFP